MSTPSRTGRPRRSTGTDIALVAGFAALIAICAILPAIKLAGPVPITLQTFGVLLAGAVLGARRGFLAVLLYVAAGAVGLPVFSGGASGLGVIVGPSGGYLLGFALAAGLCGFIVERLPRRAVAAPGYFAAGLFSSAVFIHTLGMAGLVVNADLTWAAAFDVDKVFWIGDVLKNVAMAVVAFSVHRAFPDLLPRRGDGTAAGRAAAAPAGTPAG
ncbi:biotin transporter BioY [Nocardioides sp. ChNu-153]|uniref:biotin transporter BioY n=1 Tax=unclassified Nocardioides TaxID=2615069 RepID=UPI002405CED0|nr:MULTISPECIES: biotin transporter BioY [unclassified Nocardioides]MDF9714872.1 biotin transporter BioY [Nocardioides sp. ChNu-99]MDN7120002.1 biotin transporter BioY [Nocardioides sp. ChNu-153]